MKSALITILLACSVSLHAGDESKKSILTVDSKIDGYEAAETVEELKSGLPFAVWKTFEWKGQKLLIGLSTLPTDSSSHKDVHGYIYNPNHDEWWRFCAVKTRSIGAAEVGLDVKNEELYLLAKGNTPMKGKRVFRYSLQVLSRDHAFAPRAEQDGADRPTKPSGGTRQVPAPRDAATVLPLLRKFTPELGMEYIETVLGEPAGDVGSNFHLWVFTLNDDTTVWVLQHIDHDHGPASGKSGAVISIAHGTQMIYDSRK